VILCLIALVVFLDWLGFFITRCAKFGLGSDPLWQLLTWTYSSRLALRRFFGLDWLTYVPDWSHGICSCWFFFVDSRRHFLGYKVHWSRFFSRVFAFLEFLLTPNLGFPDPFISRSFICFSGFNIWRNIWLSVRLSLLSISVKVLVNLIKTNH
jgi:hypothetical protein